MSFATFALASKVAPKSGLGFGCMGLTAFYGASLPDDEAHEVLRQVYHAGCRHFDTAEVYVQDDKHNETVVGGFLKTVPRDSYSLATKYWPRNGGYDYDAVKASLLASLQRLQLEYVDLYYAHRLMSKEGAIEFAHTAKRLKEEGLIKAVGVSEVGPQMLEELHAICPIDAIQMEWSLLTRNIEDNVVPTCSKLGITIVAYSPLARNLLAAPPTATPDDWRGKHPRYAPENLKKNRELVQNVKNLGKKYHASAAQLSLAWLFAKAKQFSVTVVPIPGSTKIPHAMSNLDAAKLDIEPADIATLEELGLQVAGERGNEAYTKDTFENHE